MKKVITYGTFDLLHVGHIKLLERAKALGDYLIVGVTSDDFDKRRGKINVQQSLVKRIEGVKLLGLADEIIIEEYEGQKIDDILNYGIDVFTVGSDWRGKFDYLKDYCEVVYLERTKGISSSELRAKDMQFKLGFVGNNKSIEKFIYESKFANGISPYAIYCTNKDLIKFAKNNEIIIFDEYDKFLSSVDAVYIDSDINYRYDLSKTALNHNKHVLCESPVALTKKECMELFNIAKSKRIVFMESIKTAYSTAFNRLVLLVKSGIIGNVISVDSTCTSLQDFSNNDLKLESQLESSSFYKWAPTALLPAFSILGTDYCKFHFTSYLLEGSPGSDLFTKLELNYCNSVATLKVGNGVKSEGNLIISGTNGYVYVPAPWWKTDYFEVRFENSNDNKRYFYKLDGEGIRYEFIVFAKNIKKKINITNINDKISSNISDMVFKFKSKKNFDVISLNKKTN